MLFREDIKIAGGMILVGFFKRIFPSSPPTFPLTVFPPVYRCAHYILGSHKIITPPLGTPNIKSAFPSFDSGEPFNIISKKEDDSNLSPKDLFRIR